MIRRLALLALAGLAASCAAEPSAPTLLTPEIVRSSQRFTHEYVLQAGDQLQVTVYHVPELNSTVVVRADGFISLPILKEVKAAGLSVPELDQELDRRYAERLNEPNVTVTVLNPRQSSVFVMGDVAKPGPVAFRDAPTLMLALAAAGGPLRTASMDNVAIVRLEDDGVLTGYVIPRKNDGETSFFMAMASTPLKSGDLVVVPESGRAQFVRFINDLINTPLTGINQLMQPYLQYETVRLVQKVSG
jgi:polysaccharide export outer membrane protein